MSTKPTYEELAESIAYCVHARMYLPEPYTNRWKMNVDHMCSTAYQIPTGVLSRLDILRPIDEIARRHDFTCLPDEFRDRIAQNKTKGCSYDTLVLALICLLELYPNQPDIRDYLARLGVCEPFGDSGDSEAKWCSDIEIKWTARKRHYDELLRNWPELLESSTYE
jgi:hypothetical protein